MHNKIAILDFGSQYTQLIARRIRDMSVYCEILPYNTSNFHEFDAVILSGGPNCAVTSEVHPDVSLYSANIPILGICYGMQTTCEILGGSVIGSQNREFGSTVIEIKGESPLLSGLEKNAVVWMSHSDRVESMPDGFVLLASSADIPFAIIADENRKIYGVQFHPEVTHTSIGQKMLENFVFNIANCSTNWNMEDIIPNMIDLIKLEVGDKKVLSAVSGGVDSAVVSVLANKALGDQLTCVFIDTGLMRMNESENIRKYLKDAGLLVQVISPEMHGDIFVRSLINISDPEQKRKIIGRLFIETFEKFAPGYDFLLQGTLYPDVIESISLGGNKAVTIKSHHNVGGLPEKMNMKVIEPFKKLFKDEVRKIGKIINVPSEIINRHPFPGPGLAIRIIGNITADKIKTLQEADSVFIESLREFGIYDEIWQAGVILLDSKSVGVMGDCRTYEYVCALRAVHSVDGMTASPYNFDVKLLQIIANRIVNRVSGINRVVYDITSKPPATIEWE